MFFLTAAAHETFTALRRASWNAASLALAIGAALWPSLAMPAQAVEADLVVINARIATLEAGRGTQEALAVRQGRIAAIGNNADIRKLVGARTQVVDAGRRTVIPGLIDSHIHAVRAGLSYSVEVNWIDARTIAEAMSRLRAAAQRARPGAWLVVAGGWTEQQFEERRAPTLQEVIAAAPENPVWIQVFYSGLLLTPKARDMLGFAGDALPPKMKAQLDPQGNPTGWLDTEIVALSALFDRLPKPTTEDNVTGTRQFFSELNRLGVTGVIDPGGFSLYPPQYAALQKLWRERALTVRVAYSLFAQSPGTELADFRNMTQLLPMGFGDDMLRFNGIGERVTLAMYNNYAPDTATQAKFYEVIHWAATQGMAVTIHWQDGKSLPVLLDIYERLNREMPITSLRWSIAHLDDVSAESLLRMKALGIGWTLQDSMYFAGDRVIAARGDAVRHMPALMTAVRAGVVVGAGTDAHRVATYNPFIALQWLLDGKTVGGNPTRGADEIPTREMALRLYTLNSAWFTFDEDKRGSLAPGKLADFAILDQDYFSVPLERVGRTVSLLTVVGGNIVYAAGPFASR
jgi:predicted amidohydrolase YtcJ